MFKRLSGLLSDTLTYGLSSLLAQAINFFLLPLYTHYLSPTDYGILAMLAVMSTMYGPLANLGMTNAIFKRFNLVKSVEERQDVIGTGLLSIVAASFLLVGFGVSLAGPISLSLLKTGDYQNLIVLTLFTAAASSIGEVPNVVLRAERRVKLASALNIFNILIAILLTIFYVAYLKMGVQGAVVANLIGTSLNSVLRFLVTLRSFRMRLRLETWKSMLSYGLPFVPHRLFSYTLTQFASYMTGTMLGLDQLGLYSVATRLTIPLIFAINAVQQAWVPYKFQVHAEDKQPTLFFGSIVSYYLVVMCYLWVGISIWGPVVLRLMTNVRFHTAANLIPLVGLIPLGQGIYYMFGTGVELSDNTRPMPVISFLGLAAVILGGFGLIPLLGAQGAALATVLGWVAMTVAMYIFAQRRLFIPYDWPVIFSLAILSFGIVGLNFASLVFSPAWQVVIAFGLSIFYPLMAGVILYRSQSEREHMRTLLTRSLLIFNRLIGFFQKHEV